MNSSNNINFDYGEFYEFYKNNINNPNLFEQIDDVRCWKIDGKEIVKYEKTQKEHDVQTKDRKLQPKSFLNIMTQEKTIRKFKHIFDKYPNYFENGVFVMPEFDDIRKWSIFVYPIQKYNRYTKHFYEPLFADHFSFLANKDVPNKISFHTTIYLPTSEEDSARTGFKNPLSYPFAHNEILPTDGYNIKLFTFDSGAARFPEREAVIDIMRFPYIQTAGNIGDTTNNTKQKKLKLDDFLVEDEKFYEIWKSNKIENIMLFCIKREKYYFTAIIHDNLERNEDEPENGFVFILDVMDIRNIRKGIVSGLRKLR